MNKKQEKDRNIKIKSYLQNVAIVLLIVLIVLLLFLKLDFIQITQKEIINYTYAKQETPLEESKESMEGYLRIIMSPQIKLERWNSAGILGLENHPDNIYDIVITIFDENNNLIYTSDVLAPGMTIEKDTLDTELAKGVHNCIAYYTALNPETCAVIGKQGMMVAINILN